MIEGVLESAKAEFSAALPDWWYVVEEMPSGETVVTVGLHKEDWPTSIA